MLGCQKNHEDSITVAASANLQYALKDLIVEFEKLNQIRCNLVVSSSGILTAQIQEGAPFDILLSADMKYPDQLFKHGLTTDVPVIYAFGQLVAWSLKDNLVGALDSLISDDIEYIALANPKTAPYGFATDEVLQHLGIKDELTEKLVYGESISQTNQFIVSKSADLGFTAKSVVLAPNLEKKGHWIDINTSWYTPIAQGVIVIKSGTSREEKAQKFKEFLLSEVGKNILNNFGYRTPK